MEAHNLRSRVIPAAAVGLVLLAAGCQRPATSEEADFARTAEAACLRAVATETGNSQVQARRVSPSATGTSVMVDVEGAQAPWNCVLDTDNETVKNLYYTGEDGGM
jgi:hypothetical protein